jgi:ADP-ribose pyrophosphatase YjhB (NUDIX family)
VKEETGLDAVFVRTLGTIEGSHYVQAAPAGPTEDTWKHERPDGIVVHCRWLPVRADTHVWGLRGDYLHALVRKRVSVYCTREHDGRVELLVFDHKGMPEALTQVPSGRVDAHETLAQGALREVKEETGLDVDLVSVLAEPEEHAALHGPGAHETTAFHAVAEPGGRGAWEHDVTGTGMDVGLVYECRWVPLNECPPLWGSRDPLVEKLRRSISRG